MGEFLWGEGARWERTFREGGVDGVVEGLALFSGALLLRNVLSDLFLFNGGIDSPFHKLVLHPHGGVPEGRGGGWETTFRERAGPV